MRSSRAIPAPYGPRTDRPRMSHVTHRHHLVTEGVHPADMGHHVATGRGGSPGEGGLPMTTSEPVRPVVPRVREVQASVLAAFQLVEDAHYFGSDRRPRRHRARVMAERAVADRKLARDLRAS